MKTVVELVETKRDRKLGNYRIKIDRETGVLFYRDEPIVRIEYQDGKKYRFGRFTVCEVSNKSDALAGKIDSIVKTLTSLGYAEMWNV